MMNFEHENVMKAIGVTFIEGNLCVILPYMNLRSLRSIVFKVNDKVHNALIVDFSHQIAQGMKYLASKPIIHRDLAARNCL